MGKDKTFRVAVIGSGTTGLAAALALATAAARVAAAGGTARKLEVVLIAPDGGEYGKPFDGRFCVSRPTNDVRAIDLWPGAFAALARLGNGVRPNKQENGPEDARVSGYVARADERVTGFWREDQWVAGAGHELERYDFRSTTGQLLWSMPAGTYGRELGRSPRVLTLRQIHEALRDTLAERKLDRVSWVSDEVESVTWHADASKVVLTSKSSIQDPDFDLVVAADGPAADVHRKASILWGKDFPRREARDKRLFPDTDATRRTTNTVVVSGIVRGDVGGDLARAGQGCVIHGQDVRFGAWRCPESSDGSVRWNAFVPRHVALPIIKGTFGAGRDADAEEAFAARLNAARAGAPELLNDLKDRLRDAFVAFPDTVDRWIALTAVEDLALHLPADRAPNRAHWVAGRVVLLGDSAHPMLPDLGLACTMAFEDAASLAETIERLAYEDDGLPDPDPEGDERLGGALAAWRDGRFARVSEVVSSSRLAHETVHAPVELPQWARDLMIAAMVPPAATQGKEKWFTPQ